ncbi:MAG: HDOD domain-containing protein [Oligoflexales bacterium]|nr:HDOD domain-containing protein [Oligoflexales bacterium]
MAPDKASLFNQLSKKSMPYIPTSVMELQLAIADEKNSATELANIAKKDPLLSADILAHANNIKTSDGQKIGSLTHAFSYIGRKTISEIVLVSAVKTFKFKTKSFSSDEFWKKSKITGIISEQLCRILSKETEPDQVYLAGALCNIGKVVAAICMPEILEKVHNEVSSSSADCTWNDAEKKISAPSHCILGEIAASLWGLADYIIQTSSQHHDLANIKSDVWLIPEIVGFANQICHTILGEVTLIEEPLLHSYMEKAKITEAKSMHFIDEIREKIPADLLA